MNTNDFSISLPASKSLSNRWLVLSHLFPNAFQLRNLSDSDDTVLLRQLLQQLRRGSLAPYNCGNAGTVARFMLPLLAFTPGRHLLTGDDRLKQRPMAPLIDTLRALGISVVCTENEGSLPVLVTGGSPRRKVAHIDSSSSSQFVSGLILAAPLLHKGLSITLKRRPASRPYIDMTCRLLDTVGINVAVSSNGRSYIVPPRPAAVPLRAVNIESDWSAASYFFTAAALLPGRRIRLKNISLQSVQGDSVVTDIFRLLGVESTVLRSPFRSDLYSLALLRVRTVTKRFVYNFIDCPDLMPTVAVACAALGLSARLRGIANLRLKECDRVSAVATELAKMGCRLHVDDDEMVLFPSHLTPVSAVDTYGDHRIAMAFAPLKILFPDLVIDHPEVVSKSFPDFWRQLKVVLGR